VSQAIVALSAVLAALGLLRLALGFAGGRAGLRRRSLRVVESCALGPRQRLVIVEVEGRRLLLAGGEGGVRLIEALPPSEAGAHAAEDPEAERSAADPGWRAGATPALQRLLAGLGLAAFLLLLLAPAAALAEPLPLVRSEGAALEIPVGELTAPGRISSTLQVLAILTFFSVAPSLLLLATCFTRIVIVLSLVRQAIGVHQLPPNQVIVGLALFLTFFVMAPVAREVETAALEPYVAREIDAPTALERALDPIRAFLLEHTREKDLGLFAELSGAEPPESPEEVSLSSLLPAFVISEIRTAFEVGFMIYLPFLVIDLVISSMLISMGMIVLPPVVISLPFKLMLFVLLDGWNLVVSSLARGLL